MGASCGSSLNSFDQNEVRYFDQVNSTTKLTTENGIKFLELFPIKMLEKTIWEYLTKRGKFSNFQKQKWIIFENSLEQYIIKNEQSLLNEKIISLLKQVSSNINETEVELQIQQWLITRPTINSIHKLIEDFQLHALLKIPEMLSIIARLIYNRNCENQYEFFEGMIKEFIKQQLNNSQNTEITLVGTNFYQIVIDDLEQIAVNHILYRQNYDQFEQLPNTSQQCWKNTLLQQPQIIDFFISQHIIKWVSIISDESNTNQQIEKFIQIRDQSKLSEFNLSLNIYHGVLNLLKEFFNLRDKIKLIKLIQASAILENFEQVAGNSMMILSELQTIIRNQDFQQIRLKNSSMDGVQFYQCNFNQSTLNNFRIQFVQFNQCLIEQCNWKKLQPNPQRKLSQNKIYKFSEQEQIIISSCPNKICFQNLHTGKTIQTMNFHSSYIKLGLQLWKLICQGQVLICFSRFRFVFWNVKCGKKIRKKQNHQMEQIQISRNFQNIMYRRANYEMTILQISTLKKIYTKISLFHDIRFLGEGKAFALKGNQFTIEEISNDKKILINNNIEEYNLSPNGLILAFSSQLFDLKCILWNIMENKEILNFSLQLNSPQFTFSPDSQQLAIHNIHSILLLKINTEKQQQIIHEKQFQSNLYKKVYFTPNVQILIFCNENRIYLWGIEEEQCLQIFQERWEVCKIAISPKGTFFLSQHHDQPYPLQERKIEHFLWKIDYNERKPKLNIPFVIESIIFSQDSQILACINSNKFITFRRISDNAVIHQLIFKQKEIALMALSPDLQTFVTCSEGEEISLWRTDDGSLIHVIQKFISGKTEKMQFSSDGKFLIFQREGDQQVIYAWDGYKLISYPEVLKDYQTFNICSQEHVGVKTSQYLFIWNIKNGSINKFKLDIKNVDIFTYNHHKQILAIRYVGDIKLWDCNQNLVIHTIQTPHVFFMVFSYDGEILAINSSMSIYLWNATQRILFQEIQSQKDIKELIFSPDGQTLLFFYVQGTCRLFRNQKNGSEQQYLFNPYSIIGGYNFPLSLQNCLTKDSNFQSIDDINLEALFKK